MPRGRPKKKTTTVKVEENKEEDAEVVGKIDEQDVQITESQLEVNLSEEANLSKDTENQEKTNETIIPGSVGEVKILNQSKMSRGRPKKKTAVVKEEEEEEEVVQVEEKLLDETLTEKPSNNVVEILTISDEKIDEQDVKITESQCEVNPSEEAKLSKDTETQEETNETIPESTIVDEVKHESSIDINNEPKSTVIPTVASINQPSSLSEMQQKLFDLRMKINQGRKANHKEVEDEYKRLSDRNYRKKLEEEDDGVDQKESKGKEKKKFILNSDLMNQTAQEAEKIAAKMEKKAETAATYGLNAFSTDASFRAYEKRVKKLPSNVNKTTSSNGNEVAAYASRQMTSLQDNPLDYGRTNTQVSQEALERLSKDVLEREEQRRKFSKRRLNADTDDVDYINDKNAKFNKKLKHAFDKYTVEIRQNLERGTAI